MKATARVNCRPSRKLSRWFQAQKNLGGLPRRRRRFSRVGGFWFLTDFQLWMVGIKPRQTSHGILMWELLFLHCLSQLPKFFSVDSTGTTETPLPAAGASFSSGFVVIYFFVLYASITDHERPFQEPVSLATHEGHVL